MADLERDFARWLRERREDCGMSLRELARKVTAGGLPMQASQVARVESGERSVRLAEVDYFAKAVGSTFREFMRQRLQPHERVLHTLDEMDHVIVHEALEVGRAISRLEAVRAQFPSPADMIDEGALEGLGAEEGHLVRRALASAKERAGAPWYRLVQELVQANLAAGERGPFREYDRAVLKDVPWPPEDQE